jgi:hypothetical protein
MSSKYLLVTIDTEALPKRAESDHIHRLIWGQFANGSAGIRQLVEIANDNSVQFVYFVDLCAAHSHMSEMQHVVTWLDQHKQDVQLHMHPEYLPESFWTHYGFTYRPRFLNQYDLKKATFSIQYFSQLLSKMTGKKVNAFRAGSFRWNKHTIEALKENDIPLSFNNSMKAFQSNKSSYGQDTNNPFVWSNHVIEIPVTEKKYFFFKNKLWFSRFSYPLQGWFGSKAWRVCGRYIRQQNIVNVLLLHSWSFLDWDTKGFAYFKNDKKISDFKKILKQLVKDYDVITTNDLLDLIQQNRIQVSDQVSLNLA